MRCPYCAHQNIPGVDLCDNCGGDLAGLDLPESEASFTGQLMTDRVGDLSMGPALVLSSQDTVRAAVEKMREARHGCVLIADGNDLTGIFTERDLLTRVVRPGRNPDETALSVVMTRRPFTLNPSDPPAFAIHRMVSEGLRHLPVIDQGRLLGFVSVRNVLRYIDHDVIGPSASASE